MRVKRTSFRLILIGLLIIALGLWGGFYTITNNDVKDMEVVNAYINRSLVPLYLQPIVLVLLYSQILPFRRIRLFVGVRRQTEQMVMKLMGLAIVYCCIFVVGLCVPYLLTGWPLFRNGSPIVGSGIILLHIGVFLFLAWLLVGAYNIPHPYLLLFAVIILSLLYNFYVEEKLLIFYSPLYDPLYRAIHKIYGGY
ncbi:hypothetical protein [Lactobacillus xylocopicola]|uniref:Uncharacterized protein n=1 Tax=Lactobacillus xylocopicola TaxID=2976676 RepID=A0ABM8BFQ1_9LACO|nr:hypothetical protein [Lactobacillus xylocopicola]BDR60038.1 hypothetical protein KIM322_02990 [Lactobacillus xylocopicola]